MARPASKRNYIVINYRNVTDQMIEDSLETSRDTLRHTRNGYADQVILKYEGSMPKSFGKQIAKSHSNMRSEKSTKNSKWRGND